MLTIEEYMEIIRPRLSDRRFVHSVEVAKSAKALAEKYGADPIKAETAGILHDITKDTDNEEQLKIMSQFGIILNDIEKITPKLWHQISGAAYVSNILKLDAEITAAVRWHTSGRKNMSQLEKAVFIADFISADRDYPGVDKMRKYASENLEKAIVEGLAFTISELAEKNMPIINDTFEAYNQAIMNLLLNLKGNAYDI